MQVKDFRSRLLVNSAAIEELLTEATGLIERADQFQRQADTLRRDAFSVIVCAQMHARAVGEAVSPTRVGKLDEVH
jgi:hypothetical protein